MSERIGVYVCCCGSNIADTVDVREVTDYASTLDNVVLAREDNFLCSGIGQSRIEQDIRESGLTRVVIAACSPHLHEVTFRNAVERAGLNPYLLEIANIREHNAWITNDQEEATRKAKALVAGGVARVRRQQELTSIPVTINPATLVVGGGIAGLYAALEIAAAGHPVYLVEKEATIGGHMAQLDKTFPTLDCAACILTPKMFTAGQHPNITLYTLSEVEKVQGFFGKYQVRIRIRPRCIAKKLCTDCGICTDICPQQIVDHGHNAGLGRRKAVYKPFAQAVPSLPVIDSDNCLYFTANTCRLCEKSCPTGAIDFKQQEQFRDITVGNIIIATGFKLFNPRRIPQYGYGRFPNVFNSLEFERMLSPAGPTGGKIVLRDGTTRPRKVAIIHCVGSRDKNYHEYCSKVCCMYSLKFVHQIIETTGAEVYSFYIDMRTPGKRYEELYHRLQQEGAHFIRGRAAMVMDAAFSRREEGHLIVQAEDTLVGRLRRIPVDMVILSPAMEARSDTDRVARCFGLGCDTDGFFSERHPKMAPTATFNDGIHIAGACQGPKDISETIAQAGAAAARVLSTIAQGQVELEPIKAEVDTDRCSGCQICIDLCPYNAITLPVEEGVPQVKDTLCKGCGICVAACPSKAILCKHYTGDQLMAQIEGILSVHHRAAVSANKEK
jgi:heterodisulfide reductase subunit A